MAQPKGYHSNVMKKLRFLKGTSNLDFLLNYVTLLILNMKVVKKYQNPQYFCHCHHFMIKLEKSFYYVEIAKCGCCSLSWSNQTYQSSLSLCYIITYKKNPMNVLYIHHQEYSLIFAKH